MNQVRSVTVEDFAGDCPVSHDMLARLIRAEHDGVSAILAAVPDATRARLAVWLYGRSHTHELGVRIASTCDGESLRRAAGLVGTVLHELSRRPYAAPGQGPIRTAARRISLGGRPSASAAA